MAAEARVLVSDFVPVYGHGLVELLGSSEGITASFSVSDALSLSAEVVSTQSNIVILGTDDSPEDVAEFVSKLRLVSAALQVLVVVDPDDGPRVGELMRTGSINLLSRRASLVEVVDTVRAAAAGRSIVPADIAPRMLDELSVAVRRAESRWLPGGLTRRELEVLSHVADGLPNRDVARILHISENTVKNHMRNIHEKMGVKTRTEAVVKAAKDGLLGSRLAKLRALRTTGDDPGAAGGSASSASVI